MSSDLTLVLIIISGLASLLAIFGLLREFFPTLFYSEPKSFKKVVQSQAALGERMSMSDPDGPSKALVKAIASSEVESTASSRLTLRKRLKYASWKISPAIFHGFELFLGLLLVSLFIGRISNLLLIFVFLCGPIFVRGLLNRSIDNRFKRFDGDYPQLLMSMVGLLKTGMTVTQALEAASSGLERHSLVRQEVQLMIERLKMGVLENQSIGDFGEDIFHPEIELFVQALLLSRKVGGNLSETLERLAKQVRRRQYFRNSAHASISLQRGSLFVIIGIMLSLECFIAVMSPELIFKAMNTEIGWLVWQISFLLVGIGILWIKQVTKIKV